MNSKVTRIIINVVLVIIIICFVWPFSVPRRGILIKSIEAPIAFKNEKDKREKEIIQRLIDIRDVELLYKQTHNRYSSNFDTLINFCTTYKIPIVKMVADTTDLEYLEAHGDFKTSADTVDYVLVSDSLFGKRTDFNINELGFVPYSDPDTLFEIHDSIIKTKSGVPLPVFEVKTPFRIYLKHDKNDDKEWETRVKNTKVELEQLGKYAGLRVGSLEEASTNGNWEKL